ncbi:SCY1-like protein 2 isoform X2 [Planococcus citri]|uniref:SCY1-like protein 2 isoform X2 n=1 Tax=Planococcus citri TaxID=170843 RepID=UPI0031F825B0
MDVLNKLYYTVSSTVSQLSIVLPGNPVTREYEATNHIASAGPGLLWKIFSGFKKSTNQEASILVLEKKQLGRLSKKDREAVLDTLRKSISQLARLRHPQILAVQHTLEESRDSLAFATEPVFASLANILGKVDNVPVPVPASVENYKLFEVEIKYGLQQIAEGFSFLHNDVKLLHRNLCPQNIVINKKGAWKIFGFDYSVHCISGAEAIVRWPTIEYAMDVHALAQPSLDYLAPESALSCKLLVSSDVFSFGMLIYTLYNRGHPLHYSNNNWTTYNLNVLKFKRISNSDLLSIPQEIREIVKLMLNYMPELRPEFHDFLKSEFFDDVGIKALIHSDSMFQWDNLQKTQFYEGLPQILEKIPHRVCLFRIIPCLWKEFVNPTMVPFVLPSVFAISEGCTKEEFTRYILPYLKRVLRMQEPVQIQLICLQKVELMLKLALADEIESEILPVLYRALECNSQQLQEQCLSVIPTFATLIHYQTMNRDLLPRIEKLYKSNCCASVRVNCLDCIGKLVEHLDSWGIRVDVLYFLLFLRVKDRKEPEVLMSIAGIYKKILNHKKVSVTKRIIAEKMIPVLMCVEFGEEVPLPLEMPLSIEKSLTANQFNAIMTVVEEMVNVIVAEDPAEIEQLCSMQEQHN